MIRIVVGGDVCPAGDVERQFVRGDAGAIFNDLLPVIHDADLSVANLECPLISSPTPIEKVGRVLGASREAIAGLAAAKWRALNLANNHSFDHGLAGLRETIAAAEGAGLRVVGAGNNLAEASEPFVTEIGGRRVVVYAMAEREFSVAGDGMAGANPLDLVACVRAIRSHKQGGLFLVLLHGGIEYYPYPSPEMVKRCRFLVEMGADAVICCHTHCPLPWEVHCGRPIVYGTGNLIFEPPGRRPEEWHHGYLARLTFEEKAVSFEAIPYRQSRSQSGARRLDGDADRQFFAEMQERNGQIQDASFLDRQWLNYCRQRADTYLPRLFAYNRVMWRFRRFLLAALHSETQLLGAMNLVQCESHREVIDTILGERRRNDGGIVAREGR